MSTTIDQRVVEMKFDNRHFESNAATTIKTLDKLKHSLKLDGASKSLEQLSDATTRTSKSLEEFEYASYEAGFSWKDVLRKISSVAEWRIAQRAIDTMVNGLERLGNAILGIEPMKEGFKEYETQMNAVQTILANTESKGTTLDDVNSALDELNKYADKTIYNFTEMTRNIGTFTAAGTDLDTSVNAIKGIANLAAVSGSTSQQASTAMYQLSQAMASGTVKLMDWNSVVNAGMGGQVFQDALKETARVHGVAIDDIISKNGSFRESLSEGWLTTEILTDTLEKFTMYAEEGSKEWEEYKKTLMSKGYTEKQAEDILKMGKTATEAATKVKTFTQLFDTLKEASQSGWAQTWEILVGDFEEAKELLTSISDVVGGFINRMSESRNELLENWKVMGGRQDLIDSFKNIFEALVSVIKPIKDAFREIFPPATAEQLVKITRTFKEFTERLKLSDKGAENLKRTFKGLFSVVKVAVTILTAVFKAVGTIIGGFGKLGGSIFSVTASLGDCLSFFGEMITSGNLIEKVFVGIGKVIKFVVEVISWLIKGAASFFDLISQGVVFPGITVIIEGLRKIFNSFTGVGESATSFKDKVAGAFSSVGNALKNNILFQLLNKLWNIIKTIGTAIGKVIGNIGGQFLDMFINADIMRILDVINGIISGGVGISLIKFFTNLGGTFKSFKDVGMGLGESLNDVFEAVTGSLKAFQNSLNAEAIKSLAVAIAILAAAVLVLSLINPDKLTDAVAAITMLFSGLMGSMAVLGKSFKAEIKFAGLTAMMIGLSVGILFLASALKKISSLNIDQMTIGLVGVVGLMATMVGGLKILSKDSTSIKTGVVQMLTVAYAVKIMAGVLLDISNLNWDELGIGIIGMVACMGTIVGAMKLLPLGDGDKIAKPFARFIAQMGAVASACKIMASVLTDLAYLEWDELAIGLVGMVTSMGVLVAAMKILATISNTEYINGDTIFSSSTSFGKIALALVGLAAAVRILVPAIETLGKMEWGELGKAGVVFAALLVAIGAFTFELKFIDSNSFLQTSYGLLIISASLVILTSALKKIAKLEWDDLAKGGAVLGGVVSVLALLSAISLYVKPGRINAMAASLAIVAASMNMLIVPLTIFSRFSWESLGKAGAILGGLVAALAALSGISLFANPLVLAGIASSVAILAASLGLMIIPLTAMSLISWSSIGKGLAVLAGSLLILTGVTLALKALKLDLIIIKISGAIALLGAGIFLVGAGLVLAGAGLASFGAGLAVLVTSVGSMAVVLIKLIPSLIEALVLSIGSAIAALCAVINDNASAITEAIVSLIGIACDAIRESVPDIVNAAVVVLDKVLSEISNHIPSIADSLFGIVCGLLESLSEFIPSLVNIVVDIIIKIFDGVAEKAPELVTSLVNLFAEVFKALGSALSGFDSDALLKGVVAVGILAKLIDILSKINFKSLPKAMAGLAAVGVLMIELGAILVIIGGLAQIPEVGNLISDGGDLLGKLSIAVLKAVPLIAAVAVLMAVSSGLSALIMPAVTGLAGIALIIGELMLVVVAFGGLAQIPGLTWLIDEGGDLLVKLAGIIGKIIGAFVGSLVGGAIAGISAGLVALGRAIKLFFDEVKDIKTDVIKEASIAALYLSAAVGIMSATGFLAGLTGVLSVPGYITAAAAIGAALWAFYHEVENVEPSIVQSAATAANDLSKAVAIMAGSGFLAGLTGVLSIPGYLTATATMGAALWAFYHEVENVEPTIIQSAANAADPLNSAVLKMTGSGFLAGLTSVTSVPGYLLAITTIGTALRSFNDAVTKDGGISIDEITAAANAAGPLSKAVNAMTGSGFLNGLANFFTAGNANKSYKNAVTTIGEAIAGFSKKVENIKADKVEAAAYAADKIADVVAVIPANSDHLIKFGDNLTDLGTNMALYYTTVSNIASDAVKASSGIVGSIKELESIDTSKISGVTDSLKDLTKAISELGKETVEDFLNEFKDLASDLKKTAKKALDSFIDGADEKKSTVVKAFKTVAEEAAEAIGDKKNSFKKVGKNVVEGFAEGISANTFKAEAKAKAMAEAALEAARQALKVNSPSKVFRDLGYSVPEGLALGIDKLSGMAEDSAVNMANGSINRVKDAMSRISKALSSDIDSRPTISPVLDLSDVKSGANSISRMLSFDSKMGVMANVSAVNSMMRQKNQNGVNNDVVSAIDKLSKHIGDNRGDTYNFGNISYDDDSSISAAVQALVRAVKVDKRR